MPNGTHSDLPTQGAPSTPAPTDIPGRSESPAQAARKRAGRGVVMVKLRGRLGRGKGGDYQCTAG